MQTDATAVAPWLFLRPADCEDLFQKISSIIRQIGEKKKKKAKKCSNKVFVLLGKSSWQAERSSGAPCPVVGDLAGCCASVPSLSRPLMGRGCFAWKEERENTGLFAINDSAGITVLEPKPDPADPWAAKWEEGTARVERKQRRKKETFLKRAFNEQCWLTCFLEAEKSKLFGILRKLSRSANTWHFSLYLQTCYPAIPWAFSAINSLLRKVEIHGCDHVISALNIILLKLSSCITYSFIGMKKNFGVWLRVTSSAPSAKKLHRPCIYLLTRCVVIFLL